MFAPSESDRPLVAVIGSKPSLSKAQREFNRLGERIGRERARLAAWEQCRASCVERVLAELQPLDAALRAVHRSFLLRADALLALPAGKFPSRKQLKRLRAVLVELALEFLARGRDPEIEALHDRHGELPHEEHRMLDLELARSFASDVLGVRVSANAESVEELMAQAHEAVAAREQKRDQQRAARRRAKGPVAAAERKVGLAEDAKGAVREVYRKLVGALHPDREADPVARERKTALMQRTNQAYERADLLALLELQLEIEQIDARDLASAPDAVMRRYNHVLAEQLFTLEKASHELRATISQALALHGLLRDPAEVDAVLGEQIAAATEALRNAENDLARLDDPNQLNGLLADYEDPLPDFDLDDLALFESVLGAPARKRSRKQGR